MSELKKTLGAISGTAMMLNVVLGAGLLIVPGLAAKAAGTASFWVWVAVIGVSLPLLWVFAMLSAKFPHAGGIAHLVGQVFGRIGSVAASFIFLGAVLLGLPSVALTGGYYYASVATMMPDAPVFLTDANSAAIVLLCLASGLNLCAPNTAKKVGAVATVLMSVFIVCIIVAALLTLRTEMPLHVMQTNLGAIVLPDNMAWRTVAPIFFIVFFAFTGWEVAIGMSGEFQNPSRNIPIAIFASFILAALLSMGCVLVVLLAGEKAWHEAAFVSLLPAKYSAFVALGAVFLIVVNLFAAIWSVSRLLFSLAVKGALPRVIGKLSRRQVPRNAVLLFLVIGLLVLLVDRLSALAVDDFLFYSGLNFFTLYGLATVVALCILNGALQKCVAFVAFLLVFALLVFSVDLQSVIYPLGLAGLGVLIGLGTRGEKHATG